VAALSRRANDAAEALGGRLLVRPLRANFLHRVSSTNRARHDERSKFPNVQFQLCCKFVPQASLNGTGANQRRIFTRKPEVGAVQCNMFAATRRWLRRNRTPLAIGLGVVGAGYVVTQYVLSKLNDARERMSSDRIAKEK
jgi:hypothetical protein